MSLRVNLETKNLISLSAHSLYSVLTVEGTRAHSSVPATVPATCCHVPALPRWTVTLQSHKPK